MAQVTIYLPAEVQKRASREAQRRKKSLSALITDILKEALEPNKQSSDLRGLYGSWEGSFPKIDDPPPADRDPL